MQHQVNEISRAGHKGSGHVGHISSPVLHEAGCGDSPSTAPSLMHEYGFDLILKTAIRVKAASPEQAQQLLLEVFDAATCKAGVWPNGEAVVFEASVSEHDQIALFSVDGEEVQGINSTIEFIPGVERSRIAHVMMQDIVGNYDDPSQVPECCWIEANASYSHREVWEQILNLSATFDGVPEKLAPILKEARDKQLAYAIFHQGT